jgi:hypothetical protein
VEVLDPVNIWPQMRVGSIRELTLPAFLGTDRH